jgi:hypothetical protein
VPRDSITLIIRASLSPQRWSRLFFLRRTIRFSAHEGSSEKMAGKGTEGTGVFLARLTKETLAAPSLDNSALICS